MYVYFLKLSEVDKSCLQYLFCQVTVIGNMAQSYQRPCRNKESLMKGQCLRMLLWVEVNSF